MSKRPRGTPFSAGNTAATGGDRSTSGAGSGRKPTEIVRIRQELAAKWGPECFGRLVNIALNGGSEKEQRLACETVVAYWLGKPTQKFELQADSSAVLGMIERAKASQVADIARAAKER